MISNKLSFSTTITEKFILIKITNNLVSSLLEMFWKKRRKKKQEKWKHVTILLINLIENFSYCMCSALLIA